MTGKRNFGGYVGKKCVMQVLKLQNIQTPVLFNIKINNPIKNGQRTLIDISPMRT